MSVDKYNRYDVYLARLPKRKGSIQNGVRPVVVFNVSDFDGEWEEYITTLNCFCLTTKEKKKMPVHFLIEASRSCLKEDSIFLAEQAVALHEDNLIEKWGNITDKEYRYMMYKTISIQLSSSPVEPMFKYPYKFLVESQEITQFLMAVWHLLKFSEALKIPECKSGVEECYEKEMIKLRAICKKYDVLTSQYITDLSNKNIDFSLLNM